MPKAIYSGLRVLNGGKSDPIEVTIYKFWKMRVSKDHDLARANHNESLITEELDLAREYHDRIFRNDSIDRRHIVAAKDDIEQLESRQKTARYMRHKAESALSRADKAFVDKMLELAGIPEIWRSSSYVEFIEPEDGSVLIHYGNTSSPNSIDWDGRRILYSDGRIDNLSIPAEPVTRFS